VVDTDGHCAKIFRHCRGPHEHRVGACGDRFPLVAGFVIDATGNWYLPFLMSMGLLVLGGCSAFLMHPEQPFDEAAARSTAGRPATAGSGLVEPQKLAT
jgi:hypothetical protein